MSEATIRAHDLSKTFRTGPEKLTIFSGLCFEVSPGESVALVGESGTGKSTLLHILGALDQPTSGEVFFQGKPLSSMSENELAAYRNRDVGYVWQSYHLLPEFSAVENVEMPLRIDDADPAESRALALKWLERVGLAGRTAHQSGELSGGEQQRVAIARALVGGPKLLLADEPTGNLDERTGAAIIDILLSFPREEGLSTVIATHNPGFASRCDRVLRFEGGRLR